jgi:peptide/nickel transport system substrate-binding protein
MTMLRVALPKVDVLPADRVTDDTSVLTLKNLVFEPLLAWDRGLARPALFSHWRHDQDGRRWEFFIRPGAVFHDGKPCMPEDILAVIDAVRHSVDTFGMKWSYARYLADARLSVGAGHSVVVENPRPFADVLDIFCELHVARLAPDGHATLGTGPYRIVEFAPRRRVVLSRVGKGDTPARIAFDEVVSADERWRLLGDGAIDVAMNLEHMDQPPTRDARFQWGSCPNTLSVMAYLNCFRGVFATHEARLAANLAVDKTALISEVFHGLAKPAATIVSPWHLGMACAQVAPITFDRGRAQAILDRIGGGAITLRTPLHMPERAPAISRFVAEALGRVGFDVTIDTQPDRPEYAREVGRKQIGDLAIFDSSPRSTFRVLNDKISSATRAVWWQGYDDAEVERLIVAANRAIETPAREEAYGACLRRLHDAPPWLYLVHPISVFAAKPGLARLDVTPAGALKIG